MNQLSWLLYAAEVGDGARGVLLVGVPFIAAFAVLACGMIGGFGGETWSHDSPETKKDRAALRKRMWGSIPSILVAAAIAILIGVFVPSKNTVMLIAASQVGETILATEQAKQVGGEAGAMLSDSMKLLHKYITDQLSDDAKK